MNPKTRIFIGIGLAVAIGVGVVFSVFTNKLPAANMDLSKSNITAPQIPVTSPAQTPAQNQAPTPTPQSTPASDNSTTTTVQPVVIPSTPKPASGPFSLSTTSNLPLALSPGSSTQVTIILTGSSTDSYVITPTGAPDGITASIASPNMNGAGTTNLILSVGSDVKPGHYTINVVAGDSSSATTTLPIDINVT